MSNLISPFSQESLDVELLKTKIKNDLIDKNVISDVNYDGSNISILVQIMSSLVQNVNSTIALNSNQTNLLLTTIRKNGLVEAKKLGYNITRPVSAKIQVKITANSNITIPQYSKFTGGDFTFLNKELITLTTGQDITVELVEGDYIDYNIDSSLRFTPTDNLKLFIIPYSNVENDNIFIQVDKNSTGFVFYNGVDDLLQLDLTENSYYLDSDPENEFLYVNFSYLKTDNLITSDDIVDISFILSNGSAANGIVDITADFDATYEVLSASSGGSDVETLDSIKSNAPLFYNTGQRTVNEYDYKAFLIKSSIVKKGVAWGGDRNYPKKLGYTYLSFVPETTTYYSTQNESDLINYLSNARIIGTGKIFKQPNYLYIDIDIKVLGEVPNLSVKQTEINTNLDSYFSVVNDFEILFYESKIIRLIEKVFENEIGSSVQVTLKPKLRLDTDLFSTGQTTDFMIPNSRKKFYLEKDSVKINLPENYQDIESYIVNGWVKILDNEEDLTVTISGTINSKTLSVSGTVSGTINIDGITYDYYDVLLDAVIIGKYIKEINILRLDDITSDIPSTQYINLQYSPQMNVKTEMSTIIEKGTITYL